MKIGLWSDNHNFPSLPLMKLSAYHKSIGDEVEKYFAMNHYDLVYASKTFTFTPDIDDDCRVDSDKLIKGGTGYGLSVINGREVYDKAKDGELPHEIEHIYPDYSLFPKYNQAYGFLTRGCCNGCEFCPVSQKEGLCSTQVAELSEFWRGQKEIRLLDPNILAFRDRETLLQQLIDSKAYIEINQGLDARFITADTAKMIGKMKIKMLHFAFDLMKNEKQIIKGLETFKANYELNDRKNKVYILTNFNTTNQEDYYRVKKVIELGYAPDIRIYQKGTHNQFLTDLQRWGSNQFIYRSSSFEEYKPRKNDPKCGTLYKDILKL